MWKMFVLLLLPLVLLLGLHVLKQTLFKRSKCRGNAPMAGKTAIITGERVTPPGSKPCLSLTLKPLELFYQQVVPLSQPWCWVSGGQEPMLGPALAPAEDPPVAGMSRGSAVSRDLQRRLACWKVAGVWTCRDAGRLF